MDVFRQTLKSQLFRVTFLEVHLDDVAAALYSLAPEDFIAARGSAQKQARSDGEHDLDAAIGKLAKPTIVAWLANQLVRERPDELGPLLELGAGLREATAALEGDQLRALSRQQHQVIDALVAQARVIGRAAGHEVNESTARGLEETLRAALADGDLADQLAKGQLTQPLEHVGFSGFGGFGASEPSRLKPADTKGTHERKAERERKAAEEREAAEASEREQREREVAEAAEARRIAMESADAEIAAAEAELETAESSVSTARKRLKEARDRRAAMS